MSIIDDIGGIVQSDVLIKGMLVEAINDMRANSWLLDYVFRSLRYDDATNKAYGNKEIEKAKKWFLYDSGEIPITFTMLEMPAELACISIGLQESVETENTLGDLNVVPYQDEDSEWPVLAGPFNPVNYSKLTGIMTLPKLPLTLAAGQQIVDNKMRPYDILEVLSNNQVQVEPSLNIDFTNATIRGRRPPRSIEIEGAAFRETYQIGCHVQGESQYLTFLHSVVVFALLRYRQVLLEARGFERSVISSSNIEPSPGTDKDLVYSRYINLSGVVRQSWPKNINNKIQSVDVGLVVDLANTDLTLSGDLSLNDDPAWTIR